MCVEYRQNNQQSGKDQKQLPRIDEICTDVHEAHSFLSFELLKGYRQIPVRVEYRPKTAFLTQPGLFLFTVMPFGLPNAATPRRSEP